MGRAEGRLPDFVIVGAMRAGSTTLYHHLAAHPDVFMPPVKELRFFERNYDRGLNWYREQFAGGASAAVRGEASPQYLASGEAMQRLARDVPEVKAIAILRHPVDRAYSHYQMACERQGEERSWDQVVDDELARRGPSDYLGRSRYADQLERAIDLLGRPRLHVIALDHLVAEPDDSLQRLHGFLGVDPLAATRVERVNAYFTVRSPRLRDLSRRSWVPASARNALARVNQREVTYPPMARRVRDRLEGEFGAERDRLVAAAGWESDPWS